ncbi:MAG: hypothetical protein J2P13_00410 [Acidobacteria bacterium]|nr:hypothetical protein [Acidobacteriota bacterium]
MSSPDMSRASRWYLIPVRVLVVSGIVTLLSFAVCLLLGICAVLAAAKLRGAPPDLRMAYRYIAAPAAAVVFGIVLVSATFLEIRHYRRLETLSRIERQIDTR